MKLRAEQMAIFRRAALRRFEDSMVEHLRLAFAAETDDLSDPELRALIRAGMAKAPTYGVEIAADVSRYIEFMVCYGPDFDTKEETRWAGVVLASEALDGTQKMDALDRLDQFSCSLSDG